MSDHTPFLEEGYESLAELPGFPYLRVEPILLLGSIEEVEELWESPQEELLFSLHGHKGRLLVVSNHRVTVYKIPQSKGFIRRAAGFTTGLILGITPLGPISDVMDAADAVKDVAGTASSFSSWVSPKQRRQRAANKAEGMPNPKDIKGTRWKTKDPEIVALITLYRERILLENAFQWKIENQFYWRTEERGFPEIHIGENKISLTAVDVNNHIVQETFEAAFAASSTFGLPEIFAYIAEMNLTLLHNRGWRAGIVDEGLVLENASFFETPSNSFLPE